MLEINNLEKILKELLEIHSVIGISGAPGIGKSEICYSVCQELGLKLLEVRLYELGETAAGIPMNNEGRMDFCKPYWFVDLEKGDYDVLFLDDFHLVVPQIQKFLYRLFTSRMLHNWELPEKLKIILAGNFNISSASASEIQSPIMGRIEVMVKFIPRPDIFLKWAEKQIYRFDTRIISFLKANPELLYEEDPPPTSKYPSPRNWEHLSKNVKELNKPDYAPGIVGEKAGNIFIDFWELLNKDPDKILNEPMPEEIPQQVIVSQALAIEFVKIFNKETNKKDRIIKYISSLSPDIIFLFCRYVFEKSEFSLPVLTEFKTKSKTYKAYKKVLDIINEVSKLRRK